METLKLISVLFSLTLLGSCGNPNTIYKLSFDTPVQLVELEDTTNTMMIDDFAKVKVGEGGLYIIIATETDRDTVHFGYLDKSVRYVDYTNGVLIIKK